MSTDLLEVADRLATSYARGVVKAPSLQIVEWGIDRGCTLAHEAVRQRADRLAVAVVKCDLAAREQFGFDVYRLELYLLLLVENAAAPRREAIPYRDWLEAWQAFTQGVFTAAMSEPGVAWDLTMLRRLICGTYDLPAAIARLDEFAATTTPSGPPPSAGPQH